MIKPPQLSDKDWVMVYWLLAEDRLAILDERRRARALGHDLLSYQQMTAQIRVIRDEIAGWAEEANVELGTPEFH